MVSILEEFARGNISPEPCAFKRDSHYGRTMQKLSDSEAKLLAALANDNELKEMFNTYIAAQAEISLLSGTDRFIYGFRLGMLLTIEVFNGKESLIAGGREIK